MKQNSNVAPSALFFHLQFASVVSIGDANNQATENHDNVDIQHNIATDPTLPLPGIG